MKQIENQGVPPQPGKKSARPFAEPSHLFSLLHQQAQKISCQEKRKPRQKRKIIHRIKPIRRESEPGSKKISVQLPGKRYLQPENIQISFLQLLQQNKKRETAENAGKWRNLPERPIHGNQQQHAASQQCEYPKEDNTFGHCQKCDG